MIRFRLKPKLRIHPWILLKLLHQARLAESIVARIASLFMTYAKSCDAHDPVRKAGLVTTNIITKNYVIF